MAVINPNLVITCGIGNCLNSYGKVVSFRKHLQRKPNSKQVITAKYSFEENESAPEEFNKTNPIHTQPEQASSSNETYTSISDNSTENEILQFILKLRVNKKISEDSTELIIHQFEELVNNCVEKNNTALQG